MAMKIRLNMVTWISDNVGGDDVCPLCEKAADTTEHVFECPSSLKEATITNLEEGKQMKKIVDLIRRNEDMRRTVLQTKTIFVWKELIKDNDDLCPALYYMD